MPLPAAPLCRPPMLGGGRGHRGPADPSERPWPWSLGFFPRLMLNPKHGGGGAAVLGASVAGLWTEACLTVPPPSRSAEGPAVIMTGTCSLLWGAGAGAPVVTCQFSSCPRSYPHLAIDPPSPTGVEPLVPGLTGEGKPAAGQMTSVEATGGSRGVWVSPSCGTLGASEAPRL